MSISKSTLVSTITKALDKQDEYNEIKYATKAEAAKLYKVKGSINSFKDVPLTGNQEGDVYNVLTTYTTATDIHGTHIKAGDNIVYIPDDGNGNAGWDVLGGTTDLSDYYTKAEIATQFTNADETISDAEIYAAVAAANPDIQLGTAADTPAGGGE